MPGLPPPAPGSCDGNLYALASVKTTHGKETDANNSDLLSDGGREIWGPRGSVYPSSLHSSGLSCVPAPLPLPSAAPTLSMVTGSWGEEQAFLWLPLSCVSGTHSELLFSTKGAPPSSPNSVCRSA